MKADKPTWRFACAKCVFLGRHHATGRELFYCAPFGCLMAASVPAGVEDRYLIADGAPDPAGLNGPALSKAWMLAKEKGLIP